MEEGGEGIRKALPESLERLPAEAPVEGSSQGSPEQKDSSEGASEERVLNKKEEEEAPDAAGEKHRQDKQKGGRGSAAPPSAPASFSYNGAVFSDPLFLCEPHISSKTYSWSEERVEICVRRPGEVLLRRVVARDERAAEKANRGKIDPQAVWTKHFAELYDVSSPSVVSGFTCPIGGWSSSGSGSGSGSVGPFQLAGAVVASVHSKPFEQIRPEGVWDYDQVMTALKDASYPLFLQFCKRPSGPPSKDPSTTSLKLFQTVVVSVRDVVKVERSFSGDGETAEAEAEAAAAHAVQIAEAAAAAAAAGDTPAAGAGAAVGDTPALSKGKGKGKGKGRMLGEYVETSSLTQLSRGGVSRGRNSPHWMLVTSASPAALNVLGDGMVVDLANYCTVGLYMLSKEEALSLLRRYPAPHCVSMLHGFNTSFAFAVRTAVVFQRAYYQPLAVMMTWPSDPAAEGKGGWLLAQVMTAYERRYTYCEQNMHASILPLLTAAKDIASAAKAGGKQMLWRAHSMGCYLLLNMMDRLNCSQPQDTHSTFSRVILDAPDVPTWFFKTTVEACCCPTAWEEEDEGGAAEGGTPSREGGGAGPGIRFAHYFNRRDNATEASRVRRAISKPYPGNDPVMEHPLLEAVRCDAAKSSNNMNHDYGRCDGHVLLDQRDFLNGEPPSQRLLAQGGSAEHADTRTGGFACWSIRT